MHTWAGGVSGATVKLAYSNEAFIYNGGEYKKL